MSANAAQRVYLPSGYPRQKALRGELELVRKRLAEILNDLTHTLTGVDGEEWRDVEVAARIGVRALTVALAAAPQPAPVDPGEGVLAIGSLSIDLLARRQWLGETEVQLTPMQHQLLATMAAEPNRIFLNDELRQAVWGRGGRSHAVNHCVCRIRAALVEAGAERGQYLIPLATGGWTLTPTGAHDAA